MGIMMLIVGSIAALWGIVFQTYSAGPYTPPQPFLSLGYLYLAISVVAIVSGIMLIIKKLFVGSIAGIVFVLVAGLLSGPIAAYLAFVAFHGGGWWKVFGYYVGLPLIILSALALALSAVGYRMSSKLGYLKEVT